MGTKYITEEALANVAARRPFNEAHDPHLIGYRTKGGTYVIASNGKQTDDQRPRDLLAVLPGDLGQGGVIQLWISVAPEFVKAVRAVL